MKSCPTKFKSFLWKNVQMRILQKLQNSIQTLIIVLACLPNPYQLSILRDICRATIFPFSSSEYFYLW